MSNNKTRSLAQQWDSEVHPAMSIYKSPINSISLFVLLDLLGSANPHIPSYFMTTHWAYQSMGKIEHRMRALNVLESRPTPNQHFLIDLNTPHVGSVGYVLDDHVPFMSRGVDILHIIPTPFPHIWHTMQDDGEHLDMPTVNDWCRIVTAFIAEWMELDSHMPKTPAAVHKVKRDENCSKTEL